MKWKIPPIPKIYEALGTVADNRIEVEGNTAKVYSSSGNKFYEVRYDPEKEAIMTNDNGSYWRGYLGYPAIAFLFKINVLPYKEDLAQLLKGIHWKNLNTKFKNNFEKAIQHIEENMSSEERERLSEYANEVLSIIKSKKFNLLGKKAIPPNGF